MAILVSPRLVMPTPVPRKGFGAVDFIPNLVATTLAVVAAAVLPPGAQASQGINPVPGYVPQVDTIPNLLGTLSIAAPSGIPIGNVLYDSAPPPKYSIQLDR